MPPDEPVRPGLPTPPAILVPRAFHLTVSWLLLATFGANWWCPVRAIKQCDPVEEGHLAQLLDLLADFDLNLHFDLGRSTVRATCLFVLPVTTYGAGLLPLPWAFLRLVSSLPAVEALNLAWVAIHKDWEFYRSMGTRDEWRWFGGSVGWRMEGSF